MRNLFDPVAWLVNYALASVIGLRACFGLRPSDVGFSDLPRDL
jgi:hypothetical protein